MKSFSKLFLGGLVAAGLTLAGCAAATTETPNTPAPPAKYVPLVKLSTLSAVPASVTLTAGENNLNATYSAMDLTTDFSTVENQWSLTYVAGATGTKAWASPSTENGPKRVPEAKALKFSLKAVGPVTEAGKLTGQNAYTILTFKNLTFPEMATRTGITFSIRGGGITANGVQATIRSVGTAGDINANAWSATLNDAPNTDWAWVWFGHGEFVNFTVPFSAFAKAANATQSQASLKDALAANVAFDQLELSFRMDTGGGADTGYGVVGTEYPYYIDNVKLY